MPKKSSFSYGAGFRSLTREIADPVALPVEGKLPSWLKGTLLRTGPSKFEVGARTYNHWFDGLAMLHRFAFEDGGVTYANRFLKSRAFCAANATGKISFGEFATDPCRTLFGRVAAIFNPKLTISPAIMKNPDRGFGSPRQPCTFWTLSRGSGMSLSCRPTKSG